MNDDIEARLRRHVRQCNHDWNLGDEWFPAPTECALCVLQKDAADAIQHLKVAFEITVGLLAAKLNEDRDTVFEFVLKEATVALEDSDD